MKFALGASSAHISLEFVDSVVRHQHEYVKFPVAEDEAKEVIAKFSRISAFPLVVGALDPGQTLCTDNSFQTRPKSERFYLLQKVSCLNVAGKC